MEHELILPAEVEPDDLVDKMAKAVWDVLAADPSTLGLYQGYYVAVCDALQACLNRSVRSCQRLGRARSLLVSAPDVPDDAGLEIAFSLAVVARIREVLDDVRAVHLVTRAIPDAIREVLEPYVWTPPPGVRAGAVSFDRTVGPGSPGSGSA